MPARAQLTVMALSVATALAAVAQAESPHRQLPARFECDRVFVEPQLEAGGLLRFYTDTGGGTWITADAAARTDLKRVEHGEGAPTTAAFPAFTAGASIPAVDPSTDTRNPDFRGQLMVMPKGPGFLKADGMLGQEWFAGKVWTFDYAQRTLKVGGAALSAGTDTVALGFPTAPSGERKTNFPSIRASVDGEELPFLLDTGASLSPSAEAAEAIDQDGASAGCGTSFITTTVFKRWTQAHPDWLVVEAADTVVNQEPMIRVPEVEIAGHRVGPVWFTRRADRNFHEFMSSMMDTKVEGALGGSLFRYFRMTVDYPNALARFEPVE